MLEWQDKFAQMQLQQHQKLVEQQRELLEAQAKEQLSRHQHMVQRMEQLEQRQGVEEQHLVREQEQLKEHISGLQEQVHLASSEREQRFSELKEEVRQAQSIAKHEVSMMKEELLCSQQELGQFQAQLKAEVAELKQRLCLKESMLRATAPEFSPPALASSPSVPSSLSDGGGQRPIQRPPQYDDQSPWDAYKTQFEMLATVNRWTNQEKAAYLAVSLKGVAVNVLNSISPDKLYDYDALIIALEARFGNAHQAEVHRMKLKSRVRRREESLTELAEDVERLVRLAYPRADAPMMELIISLMHCRRKICG